MHTLRSEFSVKGVIMCDDTRPTLAFYFESIVFSTVSGWAGTQ